jgi:hypothetical protein
MQRVYSVQQISGAWWATEDGNPVSQGDNLGHAVTSAQRLASGSAAMGNDVRTLIDVSQVGAVVHD